MASRFNVAVDLPGGRKAVLNTFTGALVTVAGATWRRNLAPGADPGAGRQARSPARDLLFSRGLLVPRDVDELDLLRIRTQAARYDEARLGVTLAPTLACNLACRYCFEGGVTPGRAASLTRAMEETIVQHIAQAARGKKHLDLCWFGGEPLLTTKAIARISARLIPACDRAGVAYTASLVTNGVLLTPETIAALARCRVRFMQVTVDIPAAEKRDRLGRPTLDRVLDNLVLASRTLPAYLRINVGRDDEGEFDRLSDGLRRRRLHERLQSLYYAYVFGPECGALGCRPAAADYPAHVRTVVRERRKALALGLPVNVTCQPESLGCVATARAHQVIGPDGRLYKCPEDLGLPERAYGSIAAGAAARLANWTPWLTYDWLSDARCARCPALASCGGGCPHRRLFQPLQFDQIRYCEGYLQDLEDRIRLRAEEHRPPKRP
jgi:uncharacterized protein